MSASPAVTPVECFPTGDSQIEGLELRDLPMVMTGPDRVIWAAKAWGETSCPIVLVERLDGGHAVQAYALLSKGAERWSKQVSLPEGVRIAKEVLRGNARTIEDFRTLRALAATVVAMAHFADQPLGCIDLTRTPDEIRRASAEDMDALA